MVTVTTTQRSKRTFNIKPWILEPRPQYLLLPIVLIMLGTSIAWYEGTISLGYAALALVGLVLCHMSVNILNDYFDFKSGVDLKTLKTPFSGGSGILPAARLTPAQVLWYGLICFVLAIPIGIFFTFARGWQLLPLLLVAAICIIFYTPVILKIHFPEWSPGVGLGILPVLGAYFAQTGTYSLSALIGSIPPGFLVLNLLLMGEFSDAEADTVARKKTLPITVGKRKAAVIYTCFTLLTYAWIIGAVIFGQMPVFALLAILTLPFAIKSIRGSFQYQEIKRLIPAMGNNVVVVLLTQALLAIGYIIPTILR